MSDKIGAAIRKVIFGSKWLLIPFYLKLIYDLAALSVLFIWFKVGVQDADIMHFLKDVDITMVANLIRMIITGSYHSFVDREHNDDNEKLTSGRLKVKMSASLAGITAVYLLQTFFDAESIHWDVFDRRIIIHAMFLVSTFVLSVVESKHMRDEYIEKKTEKLS